MFHYSIKFMISPKIVYARFLRIQLDPKDKLAGELIYNSQVW